MDLKHGGPAFPTLTALQNTDRFHDRDNFTAITAGGMTLRDYFAAQALIAIIGNEGVGPAGPAFVAPIAYKYADAMLAAREQQP